MASHPLTPSRKLRTPRSHWLSLFFILYSLFFSPARAQFFSPAGAQETKFIYLSGHGCDDMVEWDFRCTDGRRAGEQTKIGVPSCWELQGFGTYQYGMRFYGKATPEGIADEKGFYKTEFTLPQEWQGRQIELVFEAVFTEARVTINGRKAGAGTYQGGFTRHTIDVSDRVFFGSKKNRLEVEVLKESTNPQVNLAERRADYWNFGGIWRPVFIVAKPMQNIRRVAIDARADGRFLADVFLSRALPGCTVSVDIVGHASQRVNADSPTLGSVGYCEVASDHAHIDFTVKNPKLWNAEQPNLYTAIFTLKDAQGKTLHVERQRFGFRTIEYRQGTGVFINGQKVIFKGVNRHSFRPESGRTLSKAKNIEDVKLIKSMNMNAVRLSHYPADPEFLDACDSLGLYVECELPGWHYAHETIIGSQIAEEMVTRDVNHPSIIFWSNGNEGGFNYELEPVFQKLDPQQRVVLYPWANRNGFETKHYRSWGETAEYMRQKEIFMPTEFLHGLYDGGHGAGLSDYWKLMMSNPRCAGGFLWDLQDQAVLRTDLSDYGTSTSDHRPQILDPVGNFGSDGIVGPHGEREGSYYTIKEVWSPVQIEMTEDEHGKWLRMSNLYHFTNLKDCKFTYQYLNMPAYGNSTVTTVSKGTMPSPDIAPGETLHIEIPEGNGQVLQLTAIDPHGEEIYTWNFNTPKSTVLEANLEGKTSETSLELTVDAAGRKYVFSKENGRLKYVMVNDRKISLCNGPRFIAAKRADRSDDGFYNHDDKEAFQKKTQYTAYADNGTFKGFTFKEGILKAEYSHGSIEEIEWRFWSDGYIDFDLFCTFNGVVDLMGICFDYPEDLMKSKQWVGRGPYRVWQNRMEGPQYGYWQTDYNDPIPGESWQYPEFKGYFADIDWMQLETTEGKIGIIPPNHQTTNPPTHQTYVGVFTPSDGRDHLLYDLPQTGVSLLDIIPAVRNKVNTTDLNGPSAQPHFVSGSRVYSASLFFK